jgi:uncharacterized membrane protein YkvA (DUF1232 family)
MWGSWWQDLLLGLAAGLLLAWAALIAVLVIARPRGGLLREALRLLPDLLRLLPRLAADRSLPRRVRAGLALLLAYLAFPFDLVPDFIPVLGYADDAIIVAAVLRWAVAPGRYRGDPPPVAGNRRRVRRPMPHHRPDPA